MMKKQIKIYLIHVKLFLKILFKKLVTKKDILAWQI